MWPSCPEFLNLSPISVSMMCNSEKTSAKMKKGGEKKEGKPRRVLPPVRSPAELTNPSIRPNCICVKLCGAAA